MVTYLFDDVKASLLSTSIGKLNLFPINSPLRLDNGPQQRGLQSVISLLTREAEEEMTYLLSIGPALGAALGRSLRRHASGLC